MADLRETPEEREVAFAAALQAVAEQKELSTADHDALSVLDPEGLARFTPVWEGLSAGGRLDLLWALRSAAEQRLRLDYNPINHLALSDEDPKVRRAGVVAVVEDDSAWLLDRLLEMLQNDPDPGVRTAAAEDLARFALRGELEVLDEATLARLRTTLFATVRNESEEALVRSGALAALGYFSDTPVAELLSQYAQERLLKVGAIRGMGRTADPRWTPRLIEHLGDDDADIREQAATALGEIEDERAVESLVELVDDEDTDVRVAAIRALGVIANEGAREALLYAAKDGDERIATAAEEALTKIEEAEEADEGDDLL